MKKTEELIENYNNVRRDSQRFKIYIYTLVKDADGRGK